MKVLFLDIDGVLNSHRTAVAFGGIPHTTANNGRARLDEVAIRLIGGIARAAGAVVVLSSTWRKHADWLDYGPALDLPIIRGAISAAHQCMQRGCLVELADARAFSSAAERARAIIAGASQDAIVHAAQTIRETVGL